MTLHQPIFPATVKASCSTIGAVDRIYTARLDDPRDTPDWHHSVDWTSRRLHDLRADLAAKIQQSLGVSYAELTKAMEG